jgi:hypothetical protein
MKTFGSDTERKTKWSEERFPFLKEMHDEDIPAKPGKNKKSDRNRNILKGTTRIMGSWPTDITVMCICFAIAIILTVITALAVLLILLSHKNTSQELVAKTESKVLELETRCDYQEAEDELNKLRRTRSNNIFNFVGFKYKSSFETERSDIINADTSISTEHKVFFVAADDISSHQLCAIESAVRVMSNYDLYVIILSINNTDINTVSDKSFDKLLNTYPKIKVFRLKGDRYFYDSPMRDILHNSNFSSSLIAFAARVLTLWRYGGITYDADLITLDNNCSRNYRIPEDNNIMISRDGGNVMIAAHKCHSFLHNLMTSITSLYGKRHGSHNICSKDVLRYVLKKFCYDGNRRSRAGTRIRNRYSNNCDEISAVPQSMICNEHEESNTTCIWMSSTAKCRQFRKLCPVSYRQHMMDGTSDANVIALYEKKYILFR